MLGATVLSVGWGEYTAVSLPFFFFFLRIFSGGTGSVKFALRFEQEKKGHEVVLYIRSLSPKGL